MQAQYIGMIGGFIIVVAWLITLLRTVRTKANSIDPTFTAVYVIASGLLTWYSVLQEDEVFAVLNAAATTLAIVEICLYVYFSRSS